MRNKREGTFANLSKLINKFVSNLVNNSVTDISEPSTLLVNPDIKDKYQSLLDKIHDYIYTYKDI